MKNRFSVEINDWNFNFGVESRIEELKGLFQWTPALNLNKMEQSLTIQQCLSGNDPDTVP